MEVNRAGQGVVKTEASSSALAGEQAYRRWGKFQLE